MSGRIRRILGKGAPDAARPQLTAEREAEGGFEFPLSRPMRIGAQRVSALYIRPPRNAGDMEVLTNYLSAPEGQAGSMIMQLIARLSGAPLDVLREQLSADDFVELGRETAALFEAAPAPEEDE